MEPEAPESAHFSRDFAGSEAWRQRPWLVLGGGGVKGLAHIGAWRAVQGAGITPAGIVGTSIGSLIGALAASGMDAAEMRERALALRRGDIVRVRRRAVWINGIRQRSVFLGAPLREHLAELLPAEGWSALRIPLLVNAVDLGTGDTEWFGTGARTDVSLLDAVYASSALPVFYPPFELDGHAYVDGGTLRTLPIGRANAEGAERIIAVDVGSSGPAEVGEILEGGMIAIHQRVAAIMAAARRHDLVAAWKGAPLLYVRPRLAGYGTFDFEHIEYFLDEGYRATCEALGRC
ncbi:MAG TPA: patatin-like phospholipase family protein [Candidatus Limnocylindrales bacterium]|nr:patatin-like phospholipase family protein [Candidatus Limnocylindrales bacterium]